MLIDMPPEKLFQYQGCSPKPQDFDRYWEESLAELDAVKPEISLTRSPEFSAPGAECLDLRFTGVGGARIYAKLLRPKQRRGAAPAVVQFHGYYCNSGSWYSKLAYVNAGFTVAALDCRGQFGRSDDNLQVHGTTVRGHIIRGVEDPDPKKLLFRYNYLDSVQLTRIVMGLDGVDPERVGITGGSQGGGLSYACAALEPRVNRCLAVYPFLSDFRRVWNMDLGKDAYVELSDYFRRLDPLHEHEEEFFTRLGYIDIQNLAPRIRCKFRMFTGLMDTTCPPSTQFAAYNKVGSADKAFKIWYDHRHEALPTADDRTYMFMMEMLG
ncbi:MAG: acetylxylan esterase [Lentisphaeria bacterium]|nr:acetylxylan esterase [Lentisphaeria bacterium]